MTATVDMSQHPMLMALGHARGHLAAVADTPVWSLAEPDTVAALSDLVALEARTAELKMRLLSHASALGVDGAMAASSVANWFAATHQVTRREAHRATRLAEALAARPVLREALGSAAVNVEQATVIARALDELPVELDYAQVERAEKHLIGQAERFDAKALRILGRRILDVVAPELSDAHEAKLLEAEEVAAARATSLVMTEDGRGRVHGRFTLDAVTGAMLMRHLLALAAPRHRAASGRLEERRPTAERLGRALAELIQRYPTTAMPKAGGINATVVVTMTLDTLLGGLNAANLDTGEVISPGLARRLACEAGIIPAVLGGKSEVLDLGRSRRFHSRAQRIVASLEQRGCVTEGCDVPPGLTHMHHPIPWSEGGGTDRDGQMLCPFHHRRAHDPTYRTERMDTGKIAFHRRT